MDLETNKREFDGHQISYLDYQHRSHYPSQSRKSYLDGVMGVRLDPQSELDPRRAPPARAAGHGGSPAAPAEKGNVLPELSCSSAGPQNLSHALIGGGPGSGR